MNIIDLTFPIDEGMLTYPSPNHPRIEISILGRIPMEGRSTRKIVLGSHTGTHVDAPSHFIAGELSVDKLNLEILVGPAHMIDLSFLRPKEIITKEHLCVLEQKLSVERLILKTGWSQMWNSKRYFYEYPYLAPEACEYITKKGIRLLGMDVPSPENPDATPSSDEDSPNHKYFFKHGVILVEYLANLDKITVNDFNIVALPLSIAGSDGAPARVIAFWD